MDIAANPTVPGRLATCFSDPPQPDGVAIWHDEAMQRTVAVLNQKGGVGKTTVTLGLASAAMAAGRRVLVVDLDPQAASTWVLGVDPDSVEVTVADVLAGRADVADAVVDSAWSGSVQVLPAARGLQRLEAGPSDRLRTALDHVEGGYEAVLIDCPPSLGSLTRSALTAARHALVVVEPSALGLRGIGGVADLIDDVWDTTNADLELAGVVLNRVPAVSRESELRIDELTRIVGRRAVWSPPVPLRVVLNEAVGQRRPVHGFGARAAEPAAVFDALWRKVRTLVRSG